MNQNDGCFNVIAGAILIAIIFIICVCVIAVDLYFTLKTEYLNIVVTDKQSIVQDQRNKYLIFTEKEVFENTDTLIYWKWNSSDVYNNIKIGKPYKIKVCGVRWPVMSWYRNIIEFSDTKKEAEVGK